MLEEIIAKISAELNLSPEQTRAGLGILLKFAKAELGPKFDVVEAHVPGVDALIAAAPDASGVAGALGGMLGGLGGMFGGGAGKMAGLAGLVGQAEAAGLNKEELEGIGQKAVGFLEARGGKGAEIAGLIKGLLP